MYDSTASSTSSPTASYGSSSPSPGKRTLTESLPASSGAAAPTSTASGAASGAPPELLALAGTTFADHGQYQWRVDSDGGFTCVGQPPTAPKNSVGARLTTANLPDVWQDLCDLALAGRGHAPAPSAPPVGDGAWLDDFLGDGGAPATSPDAGGGGGAPAGGGGADHGAGGGEASPPKGGAASGPMIKSGASWRGLADANGWANTTDLSALDPSWGPKAKTFIDGLRSSGASVDITAGLRHPLRAILMHYAWTVQHGEDTPATANAECQAAGINIDWDHGDVAASKAAAGALASAFSLVAEPSLTSNHIIGKAVDLNITGVPAQVTVGGETRATEPKTQGQLDEDKVDHIGRDLGVIWYGDGDYVHWSHTGK